ncbi:MAG: DUF4878 domain-containing protein [Kiritimatiellae bacterium]|nr:DUF4878 domain-containing protein [Kiritimatiellia bacterium]
MNEKLDNALDKGKEATDALMGKMDQVKFLKGSKSKKIGVLVGVLILIVICLRFLLGGGGNSPADVVKQFKTAFGNLNQKALFETMCEADESGAIMIFEDLPSEKKKEMLKDAEKPDAEVKEIAKIFKKSSIGKVEVEDDTAVVELKLSHEGVEFPVPVPLIKVKGKWRIEAKTLGEIFEEIGKHM